MNRYPRDFTGYAGSPPDAQWPGGARIAVQFVLNYEEGGEYCLLHGDSISEAFLSEIIGAQGWVQQVYGVASALARAPLQVEAMQEAGWEIASHGLKWIDYRDISKEAEAEQMREAIRLHAEVTGQPPRGWYCGRTSMNTVALAAETGAFDYISDTYDDDLPYWMEAGDRHQLIIPYTLDCNDMRFATLQGFNAGDQFYAYLRDSFDALYAEGVAGQAKMMSVGLHCRLVGRPGRIEALRRFIDYIKGFEGVWTPRRIEIADHWRITHLPQSPRLRPCQMDRKTFVAAFGGVFEDSPWIAERAFDLELGPAHETAAGMHSALARMFRAASPEERFAVLKAHPDLAGKLAAAKQLTASSTAEQASAGLDALSAAERQEFEALNAAYVAKHGFPFIIAVKDHDKAGILRAFQTRIANDSEAEFVTACAQVERIARLRLEDMF